MPTTLRSLLALACVASLAIGGWFAWNELNGPLSAPQCQAVAVGATVTFAPDQTANAATITALAMRRGLPARAATIAIATAIQESKLRNIDYGDRDSIGLFQQRPSQGWGTVEQIMDPIYASNAFYDALIRVDGWQDMPITEIAQEVQRSAYPEAYADHEQEGRLLASTLSGHSPGGLGCRLDDSSEADLTAYAEALSVERGIIADVAGQQVSFIADNEQIAWSIGAYAVGSAERFGAASVTVGSRRWTRSLDETSLLWQDVGGTADPAEVTVSFD